MKNLKFTFLSGWLTCSLLVANSAMARQCNLASYSENQFEEFVTCFNKVKNTEKVDSLLNNPLYYYSNLGSIGRINSVSSTQVSQMEDLVRNGILETLKLESKKTEVINAFVAYICDGDEGSEGYLKLDEQKAYYKEGLVWTYRDVVNEIIKEAAAAQDIFAGDLKDPELVKDYTRYIQGFKKIKAKSLKQARLVDAKNSMRYDFYFSNIEKTWKLFLVKHDSCSI